MDYAKDQTGDISGPEDCPIVRWRPWPCESCRGRTTPLGLLVPGIGSDAEGANLARNEKIDRLKKSQADQLLAWVESCEHSQWTRTQLPKLKEGSEHLVLFDGEVSEVVKITLSGTYGDYYEIIGGQIHQFDSTPEEYLVRMRWWEKLFSTAPAPLGITPSGSIVSRQKFILGDPNPPQELADQFLIDAGAVAVRQSCWLWKKTGVDSRIEVWIGDARSDNFILAEGGIVPIDLRIWGVPLNK